MVDRSWFWPCVVIASAAVALGLTIVDWDHPIRSFTVLWVLCVCPGLAILHPLELPDPVTGLALVVPLSLSIDAIIAGALLYAGAWSASLALACVVVVSLAALAAGGLVPRIASSDEA